MAVLSVRTPKMANGMRLQVVALAALVVAAIGFPSPVSLPAAAADDDYPLRIYVIFQYDPAGAPAGKRFQYGFAKAAYGEYPPDSGVNYIWESRASLAVMNDSDNTGEKSVSFVDWIEIPR